MKRLIRVLSLCLLLVLLAASTSFGENAIEYDNPNWISVTRDELISLYQNGTPFLAYCYMDMVKSPSIIDAEYLMDECGIPIYACGEGLPTYLLIQSVEQASGDVREAVFLYDGTTLHFYNSAMAVAEGLAAAYPQVATERVNYYYAVLQVNEYIYNHYSAHQAMLDYYSASNCILPQAIQTAAAEIVAEAGAESDMEKAKALFDWVSQNITYDKANPYVPCAFETYKRRYGVCEDYSMLYTAFCRSVGLTCRGVGGNAYCHNQELLDKKYFTTLIDICCDYLASEIHDGYLINEHTGVGGQAHAWNEVWVDDRWVIVDCTWGDFDLTIEELSETRILYNAREADMSVSLSAYPVVTVKLTEMDESAKSAGTHLLALYDENGRFIAVQVVSDEDLDPLVVTADPETRFAKLFTVDAQMAPAAELYLGDRNHLDRLDNTCLHDVLCE